MFPDVIDLNAIPQFENMTHFRTTEHLAGQKPAILSDIVTPVEAMVEKLNPCVSHFFKCLTRFLNICDNVLADDLAAGGEGEF